MKETCAAVISEIKLTVRVDDVCESIVAPVAERGIGSHVAAQAMNSLVTIFLAKNCIFALSTSRRPRHHRFSFSEGGEPTAHKLPEYPSKIRLVSNKELLPV
jgi:hypothetical protein